MHREPNRQLLAFLDELVAGQEEAKKALILLLNRSITRAHQKFDKLMHDDYLIKPMKVLLIGKSGHGKTHLVESLQNLKLFPLVKLDATEFNPTGASGGVKTSTVIKRINEMATHYHQAFPLTFPSIEYAIERTVVFVDEVDKLGDRFEGTSNGWNKHTQSCFLTLFDNKETYSGVSFIFAGAFTDITNKKEVKKNSIGFSYPVEDTEDEVYLDEQVIASGIMPEIVGRMNTIVKLEDFTKEQMITILKERVLPKKYIDLAALDVFGVEMDDEKIEEIAEKAASSTQGVRYLHREVDKHFMDVEFNFDNDIRLMECKE